MAKKYKEICEEQKEIIKSLENKLKANDDFTKSLNKDLSDISENVANLRDEISAKDIVINNLNETSSDLKFANDKLANIKASLESEIAAKTTDFNNLQDIKVKLEAELAEVITVKDNLAYKLANVIEINVKFKNEVKSLNDKLVKQLDDNMELRRNYDSLSSKSKTDNDSLIDKNKELDHKLALQINANYELERKIKAHDTMSAIFGLIAALAILCCLIFG